MHQINDHAHKDGVDNTEGKSYSDSAKKQEELKKFLYDYLYFYMNSGLAKSGAHLDSILNSLKIVKDLSTPHPKSKASANREATPILNAKSNWQ